MPSKLLDANHGDAAVLVAHDDTVLRSALANTLRQDGYNVLEADDLPSIAEIVLTQTRPVHVLADPSDDKRLWATRLTNHRPNMVVWFVERHHPDLPSDVLTPEIALATIREFFNGSRGQVATGRM